MDIYELDIHQLAKIAKDLSEENARLEHEWQIRYDKLWDEAAGYRAEVKRLEGLILDWYSSEEERPLLDEAKRIRGEQ